MKSVLVSITSQPPRPGWLRAPAPAGDNYHQLKQLITDLNLHTVCESAACPNVGECWNRRTATFMILGNVCTRRAMSSYTWSVSGPGSANYTFPPNEVQPASTWPVGRVFPQTGVLTFQVVGQTAGGAIITATRTIEVGIRSDDVIVVGWINASGVPLPSSITGVDPGPLANFAPNGQSDPNFSSLSCNSGVVSLALNDDTGGTGGSDGITLTPIDREYILDWLFFYAANTDPTTVLPGGNFRDSSIQFTSESTFTNFVNTPTNYKLVNRLQVKFRSAGSGFNGPPTILNGPVPSIGTTINPCGYTVTFAGQIGPANGSLPIYEGTRMSQINDGSPDSKAVRAFNTLEGKDVTNAVFWENIGSRITFSFDGGPTPQVVLQPYPTYYEYHNGALVHEYPEAGQPVLNFNPNPYPSGTVPCTIISPLDSVGRTTPGGRCGDQASPPDPSARTPSYVQP